MKTLEINEHVCGKCCKTFRRFDGLKRHLDLCRFDGGYSLRKAEMCRNLHKIEEDAVLMDNKDLCFCCGESYDTCHVGKIRCPDCTKSFKTQSSYERHIFITHSEFNDFPCTICNAKLRSENLLHMHIQQHQNRGKPYACKICGKDFSRSITLKRHQKYSSCNADQSNAIHCKVCDKVFFRLANLRAHLKQHSGESSKKKREYMCPVCKNCFYSLSTLNIHTRTHGERPYDCDLCDKKCTSLVALKTHRRYHTGDKPHTCSVCLQSFVVKGVLNRHMKRHTGERPHVCTICKKTFVQADDLKSHARTHFRPFKCKICSEAFKTEKQLLQHWKISRNKCTDCAICQEIFDTVQNLEVHILKVHNVDPEDFMNENTASSDEPLVPSPKNSLVKLEQVTTVEDQYMSDNIKCISPKCKQSNGELNNIVVDQEFIVDELPSTSNATQQIFLHNDTYTIIPLNSDGLIATKTIRQSSSTVAQTKNEKINQRKSLAESLAAAIADDNKDNKPNVINEENEKLNENVSKLLDKLVDKKTLKKFGWPENSVENVLCKVIENCGHNLSQNSEEYKNIDFTTRMREYVKLFFTVVIQNDPIKVLLNNSTIDDVIEHVLGKDDDEDDDGDGVESGGVNNGVPIHVTPKYYLNDVVPQYTEVEFRQHFRISTSLFESLCNKMEDWEHYNAMRFDKRLSTKTHIAVFLWFAGHEACSYRDVADRFNLCISSVCRVIHRTSMFLSSMAPSVIVWPNEELKQQSSAFFANKCGFDKTIGCIDGTRIVIDPPSDRKDDYIDRKGNVSLSLQGICNEKNKFIDVFLGHPGSCHDSWILKNSPIYRKLPSACGDYYLLGDSAYPCSQHLITPYRDNGHLTRAQTNFNIKLSSGRVAIEHSFGILKQRFRQLYYCKINGIKQLCHFIMACCVLHNIANENDLDFVNAEEVESVDDVELQGGSFQTTTARDAILQQLQN